MPYNITSRVEAQSVERQPNGKWAILKENTNPRTGMRQPIPVEEYDTEQQAERAAREAVDVVRRREDLERQLIGRMAHRRRQEEEDDDE